MSGSGVSARPLGHTLAVTSGKGGVGKTVVAANLGAALARLGRKVLVLDADLGLANLDVLLNLPPHTTIHDVLVGKCSVDEAIRPGPGGISVLLAGSGMVEYSRMTPGVREQLGKLVADLAPRFDHVILDTGSGISEVVLFTVSLAQQVLLVLTPEPASLTDAYATVKVLATTQKRREIAVLPNQTRRPGEGRSICGQLQLVIDRFVSPTLETPVRLEYVGELPDDPTVRETVARRELLLEVRPGCPAAMALLDVALRLVRE